MTDRYVTTRPESRLDRNLARPWAFAATTLLLLTLFGWTFVADPGRPAAADDPAYYAWRTEALIADDPQTLLEIDGPLDMYSGGYRVATPIVAGLIRQIADVSLLTPTIVLAVGLRVVIPLLLAGFAYRSRRDPLVWHSVALGSASLLLTPPFAGYLDNMMALLFLATSLYLIDGARTLWRARIGIGVCLFMAGLTHPTTLAVFCLVLGAMAAARLIYRRFEFHSVLRDDGPLLLSALASVVATYAVWKVGVWGEPASLGEAALPPPASADFFKTRLNDWLAALRPVLNGPLFLAGAVGLLAAGRRAAEDELTRVAVLWLAPLVGLAGVFAGLTYPYYRFLNTTLAWVLLVGIGGAFVIRYVSGAAHRKSASVLGLVVATAVAVVFATNLAAGFDLSNWNDPGDAWIKPDERTDLDALRSTLGDEDQPIVFVVDDEAPEAVRIYGFAKRAGNVSRYGVPSTRQDRTAYYLGSIENFVAGRPTTRDDYYEDLSQASLDDAAAVVGPDRPLVVVPEVFNRSGANAGAFTDEQIRLEVADGPTILYVEGGRVGDAVPPPGDEGAGIVDVMRALLGALMLLLPGALLFRYFVADATVADMGMIPAISVAVLGFVAFVELAVVDRPLTMANAWVVLVIAIVASAAPALRWRAAPS
jgi:hypothetical protein